MTHVQLRDPFGSDLNENRLREYQKIYNDLRKDITSEDKEVSNRQTTKLKEFIKHLREIKSKAESMHSETNSKNINLKKQIDQLEHKLQGFQIGGKKKQMEKKHQQMVVKCEKSYISCCEKRITIADSINYSKFQEIEIEERKSLANQVFKWILVAIYTQPENKFYWPNFKEQVIENEEGRADLKQRLGKFSALTATQEQRVKTLKFIESFEKVKVSAEFNEGVRPEIQKIYEISRLFLDCSDIGKKIKESQKEIQAYRSSGVKDDEVQVQRRNECDYLTKKYRTNQLYLDQLTKIQASVAAKLEKYYKQVELAEFYVGQLSNVTASKLIVVESKNEGKQKENWECAIF